jgi:tRNA 2-thiouridine synthesizing protein C
VSKKSLLILFRHAPYGHSLARAGYDVALAAAAFDQPVSLLFLDDGVWQLVPDQNPEVIGAKSIARTLDSLALYDIDGVYAEAASLAARGLSADDLRDGVRVLGSNATIEFVEAFDQLVSF